MDSAAFGQQTVFTIGHSSHSFAQFVALLHRYRLEMVADVRSVPYSRRNPQYNRKMLDKALAAHGIAYRFLGAELGARSEDASCYEDGKVQYRRLAQTALFRSGLQQVIEQSQYRRLTLMCAEKQPLDCHRTILVARELADKQQVVQHILADGSLQSHTAVLERLCRLVNGSSGDLFAPAESRRQLEARAYAARERKIAYADPSRFAT